VINKLDFAGQDEKIKKYVRPQKILLKRGNVLEEENLFVERPMQISTSEPHCAVFSNGADGENAMILLDFGVEFAGGIRILTDFIADGRTPLMRITFGESAAEALSEIGFKNATNDHSIRDMDIKLSMFSDMEFGQTGFRFVRIELLEKNFAVRIKSILGVFTYRELEYKGTFECSDPRLNEIYDVCAYTCHLNMQSMLWDGIKRDRLVWIGDMHPEMLTVRTVFGNNKVIEDGLKFTSAQFPLPQYPNNMVTYAMWWLLIAYDWYFYTGEAALINEHKQYILTLLQRLCSYVDDSGFDILDKIEGGYFLDWPTFHSKEAVAGVRALFSMALSAGEKLCELLYDTELSEQCRKKRSILNRFIPNEYNSKVPAAFMVLADQLDAKKTADEILLPGGVNGMSTFLSYYILSAIAKADKTAEALVMLKTYYGGMLDAGATTFWEDFDINWLKDGASLDRIPSENQYDIHGDNGAHCYVGYRHSLCHGWSSGPTAFLSEQVLGIQIAEPGCKKVRIKPNLGHLEWAKGTFSTPYGIVSVSHVKQPNGSVKTEFTLPDGVDVID